jgi:hypothetical protein
VRNPRSQAFPTTCIYDAPRSLIPASRACDSAGFLPPLPSESLEELMLGRFFSGPGLRGFRPRSESNYLHLMGAALGVATGVYIFSEPLHEASKEVQREKAGGESVAKGEAAR